VITIADLLRDCLAEEDYTVPNGTGIDPFDRRNLVSIADGIMICSDWHRGENRLDVWQDPSGRNAGITYRVDENGTVAPGSAEVVPVKATYMIEEA